ncbi:unnamed protein product [Echinostoma caproni]|uniref:tRNA (adenine(58)-N(1))-methyltransferase n=1 Tax=Echinostoma caproni TaxID=27848 RepID=A0A183AUA5_9TREM|nr:unnamed protein product [Echinostoma caproni]
MVGSFAVTTKGEAWTLGIRNFLMCQFVASQYANSSIISINPFYFFHFRHPAFQVSTSRGHVHMLAFDPVLWSYSLPHRTQIIYPPDASLIVGGLDLLPGKCVMEAGTGSGSLTHFLAQAIWPTGRVRSFEFHLGRVGRAIEEFQSHELSNVVSVTHRDVCADGFPPLDGVDAVSLDLPQPWLVIPSLPSVFRTDYGRVCSFSPCIEQVQRTALALKKAGFVHIQTMECLQRNYDVVRAVMNVPNLGRLHFE